MKIRLSSGFLQLKIKQRLCILFICGTIIYVTYVCKKVYQKVLTISSELPSKSTEKSHTSVESVIIGPMYPAAPPINILLWTEYYKFNKISMLQNMETKDWLEPLKFGCDLEFDCVFTTDREKLNGSDAVVFHSHPFFRTIKLNTLPAHHKENQIWIYFTEEAPTLTMWDFVQLPNVFNWTMSYRRDSDVFFPYGGVIMHNESSTAPTYFPNRSEINRTKLVAWTASRCSSEGRRENYVLELQKYVPVDIYGGCGSLACNGTWPDGCFENIAYSYKFYLAFENSLCKDYVTEKFYNCLRHSIVPVVYGFLNYSEIAPPKSFIDARSFKSPKHLANYLKYLDEHPQEYQTFFKWKERWKVLPSGTGWCSLCKKLQSRDRSRRQHYKDLFRWIWSLNGEESIGKWRTAESDPIYGAYLPTTDHSRLNLSELSIIQNKSCIFIHPLEYITI